jgi:hypothetical protein
VVRERLTWDGPDGAIWFTHAIPIADAETIAWDVETIAHGEDSSVLRVLVGLLALGPLT